MTIILKWLAVSENRATQKVVKTAKRLLCLIALSTLLIGCGEETPDFVGVHADADPHDIDAYYHWWDIAAINGKKMNIRRGSVYFSGTGEFTHEFKAYRTTVNLSDDSAIIVGYTYTNRGRYTTRRNRLTITESSPQREVDVRLDPEVVRQTRKEAMALEALKAEFAAEVESSEYPLPVFKSGTEYTWQIEDLTLTLSSPHQRIVLKRQDRVDELEGGHFWW